MAARPDYALVRILGENCVPVDGGHEFALIAYVGMVNRHGAAECGWKPKDKQS